jgi:hypothetical protein
MNSKQICIVLSILCMVMLSVSEVEAQTKKKKKKEPEKEQKTFKQRLWYGGGFNLGFAGFQGTSSFGIGVSPMVGYKILPFLSVGPRYSVFFTSLKYPGAKAVGLFDQELGGFVRAHVYRGFFIQGELSNEWAQEPFQQIGTVITKRTYQRGNQYLGIGYNFGRGEGGAGSELSLHYNFAIANDIYATEQPVDYRFGFTWRF